MTDATPIPAVRERTADDCSGPSSCGALIERREILAAGPYPLGDVVDPDPFLLGQVGDLGPVYVPVGDYMRFPEPSESADTLVFIPHRLVCPLKATILERLTAEPAVQARMASNSQAYRERKAAAKAAGPSIAAYRADGGTR